jgi:nucleotide-binding universal stress UspA family protein
MFKNILVPLDGSNLAEAALAPAASLAATLGASVMLLHVIEKNAPQEVHHDRHLTEPGEAEHYLREVAARALLQGVKVGTHVHTAEVNDVPASIVQHTGEFKPDLVVMCAHGKSGIRDLLFGSIAQQVISQSATPLLLLQPMTSHPIVFHPGKILIPIDNESLHDVSLPVAQSLASAYDADLSLLCVIPTLTALHDEAAATGSALPATTNAILNMNEEDAKLHIQDHMNALIRAGFRAFSEVARGDPAQTIVHVAEHIQADMIILSTHRRSGLGAFWAHSVAPDVVRRTHLPILLIPIEG